MNPALGQLMRIQKLTTCEKYVITNQISNVTKKCNNEPQNQVHFNNT